MVEVCNCPPSIGTVSMVATLLLGVFCTAPTSPGTRESVPVAGPVGLCGVPPPGVLFVVVVLEPTLT